MCMRSKYISLVGLCYKAAANFPPVTLSVKILAESVENVFVTDSGRVL